MEHFFYFDLEKTVAESVREICPELTLVPPLLEIPKGEGLGDFSASVALKIAALNKTPPMQVAETLKRTIFKNAQRTRSFTLSNIETVKPGFINIFLDKKTLADTVIAFYRQQDFFKQLSDSQEKILIEFVSANPTGPLSIAHGRQAIIGDVLTSIFKLCGYTITKQYYVNDEGKQIDLLVESFKERLKQAQGKEYALPEQGYHGQYLLDSAAKYAEKKLTEDPGQFCLSEMVETIKRELSLAGVTFDLWTSQKKLRLDGAIDEAIALLKEKGYVEEKEGATWFKSTLFGDDKDRVLVKQDGSFTYFAADIAFHYLKIKQGFNRLINLWGPDHHGYIPRMKAAIQALGFTPSALTIIIIQLVTLKNKEKMSKRKGNIILLSDLIAEVGKDAARFYYITRKNSSLLDFDIQLAKTSSFDNPLYYIQYAHARICSILRKAQEQTEVQPDITVFYNLKEKEEIDLLRILFYFPVYLLAMVQSLEPFFVTEYLKKLAASFHKFYEAHKVISENKDTTAARIALINAVKHVFGIGMDIMGISAPDRM